MYSEAVDREAPVLASVGGAVAFGMVIGGLSGCPLLAVVLVSTLSVGVNVADTLPLGALLAAFGATASGESFNGVPAFGF